MRNWMFLALAIVCITANALTPAPEELADAAAWANANLGAPSAPFSFVYDGIASAALIPTWQSTRSARMLDDARTELTWTYTEPQAKLVVRCVAVLYSDFPAVEWTVYLKNEGSADTAIFENIQALDTTFAAQTGGQSRLFYSTGSHSVPEDFTPVEKPITEPIGVAPYGGRSSDGVLPFFRIEQPGGGGVIMGIGWTGQWAAHFAPGDGGAVMVRAGMEQTHLRLHPGEEIRTPAILLLFWNGAHPLRANNLLRGLLLKHFSPTPGGKPALPPVAASPHGVIAFEKTTETNLVSMVEELARRQFPVDTFWIDAGWNGMGDNWARAVGSWEPNAERFPNGLKPVADAAHAHGMRFLVWFEPERVMPGTWLHEHHPEWLLKPGKLPEEFQYHENDGFHLLDLGNPEAWNWAKETFSRFIGENGIDIYRQDFNLAPLYYWRNGEPADRQGINEIRHITGLYAYFDALLREHPGLLIDNCASGGRRIDFEIMRRALSLWRSDCCWETIGEQAMNYGISFWMPETGVGSVSVEPYAFRSGFGSHLSLALDFAHDGEHWERAAATIRQWQPIRHLFTGDFYPITPHSVAKDQLIAWQYHTESTGEGIIQAFRREECNESNLHVRLQGLDPAQTYTLTNFDTPDSSEPRTGQELMEPGITVTLPEPACAVVIHYKKR